MKRIIGLSLLILANIMILAHTVIPHHHHNGVETSICFFFCINETTEHHHDHNLSFAHRQHCHDAETHEHDDKSNDDCILRNLYLPSNQGKQLSSLNETDLLNAWDFFPLFIVATDSNIEIKNDANLPFRQKPHLASSYNHYVTHSLGLRAPPVC